MMLDIYNKEHVVIIYTKIFTVYSRLQLGGIDLFFHYKEIISITVFDPNGKFFILKKKIVLPAVDLSQLGPF